ncbi:hypothetical protein X798_00078 [Onchocerca flexuosa]|uniref:Uncharacterized protein n=1 Tax=Onchocerca flexuosa TaxID=387005 RepID=A0A238C4P8_9BILA|nr:hypothetical protein X798_00078 [Onchocerca flexuosa]
MAKSPRHRSTSSKKSPSKNPRSKDSSHAQSPQSKDSSHARSQLRKTSRSRSRSRSTPRSRSSSRSRGSASAKKKSISPIVKKIDDSEDVVKKVGVKKIVPVYRTPKNGSSYKLFSFPDKGLRRRNLTVRMLPMNLNNLKVKGTKLKQRLSSHCRRWSRYYAILLILGFIGLGIFYTGYTMNQFAKYARQHISTISAYVQQRI